MEIKSANFPNTNLVYNTPINKDPSRTSRYYAQQHIFRSLDLGTAATVTKPVFCSVPFKVQKIRFDFAYYNASTVDQTDYIVSSDITNNELVGQLNKFSNVIVTAGPTTTYYCVDGFSNDKMQDYVFKDPITVNGDINFKFTQQNTATIASARVVVHIEFLGN